MSEHRRFVMLECPMWNDPAFTPLSTDARVLFIWTWSDPEAAICGLWRASVRQMGNALGPPAAGGLEGLLERVDRGLEELAAKPLVAYDYDAEVLWVINRAAKANRSPKTAVAMVREYQRCPASPLREAYAERYPHLTDEGGRRAA